MVLDIGGEVLRFVTIEPKRVVLNGYGTAPLRQAVMVIPEERFPFQILQVETRDGVRYIDHRLEAITHNGRPAYRLTLENRKVEAGRYAETVTLTTDNPLQPKLYIQVSGNILVQPAVARPQPLPAKEKP